MRVGGFEIDVGAEIVTRDGDGEVQEGEGGIGDGPGEFEVGMKGVGKVDELFKLLMGVRGSADTIINVMGEEVLGAGELKLFEEVEDVDNVLNVSGEFLDQEGKDRVR
eukprot:g23453.t1